ncbi:MAG: tetratricopeptide repeat protein [Candidatus Methanoperedens sp.]|nr:tetratricopeptide repeat protein [Candidatus Methanoperedens sp.]
MAQENPFTDMHELLLRLGYHETSLQTIICELDNLLKDIGFDELEKKAHDAIDVKDASGLINVLNELMKCMENKGIYRPDYPVKLIELLVNGLNLRDEDIFIVLDNSSLSGEEIRKEQEFLSSCAAITQLGYILLYRLIGEVKAASSGEHVFILIDHFTPDSMIFVDFSIDSILEIDAKQYDRIENNYSLRAPASDDETSKHIAQYYSYFHAASGIGLSHNIHNNIGLAYDQAGLHREAISEFNEALRLDPGYLEVLNNIAVSYHRMGLVDEAIEKLREAISFRPGYIEAHCNLGSIYASSGWFEEALSEFNTALSINPESALVHNNLGNLYIEQERFPEAIMAFQEAVKLDPEYLPARSNLGTLYSRQGRHEDALREFSEVLRRDPELPEAYCGMGSAYYELGSFEKSARAWMRAVYFAPELIECVPEKLLLKVKRGISRGE